MSYESYLKSRDEFPALYSLHFEYEFYLYRYVIR